MNINNGGYVSYVVDILFLLLIIIEDGQNSLFYI